WPVEAGGIGIIPRDGDPTGDVQPDIDRAGGVEDADRAVAAERDWDEVRHGRVGPKIQVRRRGSGGARRKDSQVAGGGRARDRHVEGHRRRPIRRHRNPGLAGDDQAPRLTRPDPPGTRARVVDAGWRHWMKLAWPWIAELDPER